LTFTVEPTTVLSYEPNRDFARWSGMNVADRRDQQESRIGDLSQELVDDGFTLYCCGSKDNPTALMASYEWDHHIDVITVRENVAAAARLPRSDIEFYTNPPDFALWSYTGEPTKTIWELLKLPPPEHPDAPDGDFPTPPHLRVPRESQRPMAIRKPASGKAGARAERLRRGREGQDISRAFFGELFRQVDSKAAVAAAENFDPDVGTLHFANYPPMVGRAAIAEFVTLLFKMAAGVEHVIYNFRELSGREAFTNGVVTFTRLGGSKLTVPFCTFSLFDDDLKLLTYHQVYVDASDLVPAREPVSV
jgi:hypothetical protein